MTAIAVKKLTLPGLYFVGGVPNLALHVSTSGSRSWILRYSTNTRRREMGLGPYPEVSLHEARNVALEKRALLRQGIDPIEKRREMAPKRAVTPLEMTFQEAATKYIASHRAGWKCDKHSQQWESTLAKYAFPRIGDMSIRAIGLKEVLGVLEPIWWERTETATRLRGRLELILAWAKARGLREGDNPATWKGNLQTQLPARSKLAKVKHHAALPWEKCPEFYASLFQRTTSSVDALKLCILTATRSGEVRGAKWVEMDLEKRVWTIPAERMKAGREHRIPLTDEAVRILMRQPRFVGEDLVFSGRGGSQLSDMTLLKLLRDSGHSFTVHGFRSSFRDWAGESTQFPREVIEHALAHQLKDKAEAAYARGDQFRKRIALMESWSSFLQRDQFQRASSQDGSNANLVQSHRV